MILAAHRSLSNSRLFILLAKLPSGRSLPRCAGAWGGERCTQVKENTSLERCTEDRHVAISPAMLRSSNGIVEFKPTAARMSKSGLQVTYPQPRV